jgi:hypothetical protein
VLYETRAVEEAWEDGVEPLLDLDVLCPTDEVMTGDELPIGVVAGPVTRQEHADEILDGEFWH